MRKLIRRGAGWARIFGCLSAATAACVVFSSVPALAASNLSQTVDTTYQTNGRVDAITTIGDTVYLGGAFTAVRPAGTTTTSNVTREHLAAFDRVSGALLPWNPGTDKEVLALAPSPDGRTVYVGGSFSRLGGVSRLRLAAVDAVSGAVNSWAPTSDQQVDTIAVTANWIYFGGTFDKVNNVPRVRLAAVDHSGVLNAQWQPQADDRVRVITPAPDGQSLFLGGDFLSIDGSTQNKILARVTADTAALLPWMVHPGYPLHSFGFFGSTLFAAGDGSGGHIGAFDLSTGNRLWTLQTDGGVQAMTLMDGVLYAGGHFDNVCVGVVDGPTSGFKCPQSLATRHKLVAIDPSTGALDSWNPGANTALGVFSLATDNGSLDVGGDFTKIGSPDKLAQATKAQQGFGQLSPVS